MSFSSAPSAAEPSRNVFKASLRRTLIQTLLLLTIIPLMAMGLAAYLRASGMLRQQAITNMQSLLTGQMNDLVLLFKTKSIRLERMANRSDLTSIIEQALHVNRQSTSFNSIRGQLLNHYQAIIVEAENPTFNQFFIVRPSGDILISSRPEWEGVSVRETELYQSLNSKEPLTTTIYDLPFLYPQQLATFTIQPYITSSGSYLGALVGVTESQSLTRLLQPLISLGPSADAYFVTKNGTLVGTDPYTGDLHRLDSSPEQQATLAGAFETIIGSTTRPAPMSVQFRLKDGNPVIAQTEWAPILDAAIVLQMHESAVLGQINSLIPFTFVIVAGALLAMALVIGAGINRLINPIISLTRITRRFAEGDLRSRATVESKDEIGLLSHSFNQMANELGSLYQSLEEKVEERTRQIRTAAEVAQGITAASNLDDLMRTTTRLIVDRFGYYHAAIFMLDRAGENAVVRAAYGPVAQTMLERGHSLEVGSNSIIGWATANNKPRVASDVSDDPVHFKNTLLPDTRAEAGIPIASGAHVFGALDVQSVEPNAFDTEAVIVLQTLANQIAAAIQNAGLVESTQINFQELERLYRTSRQIAQAQNSAEALNIVSNSLRDSPYLTAIFVPSTNSLRLSTFNDPQNRNNPASVPREIPISPTDAIRQLTGTSIFDFTTGAAPGPFAELPLIAGCQSAAYLPIMKGDQISAVLMIASRREQLGRSVLQPYVSLTDLTSITLEKLEASEETEERLRELNALASIGQTVASAEDAHQLYESLHKQVQSVIGDYSFSVTLYDPGTDTIQVPYNYEDGRITQVEALPAGEGLVAMLLRTQEPLLLAEDTERRASRMGAKIVGRPAQSWMGAPMILRDQAIGALIVQDLDHEHAFTENNLRFLSALSAQLAGVIFNTRLLEESRVRAVQLETAAEIARDISSSLDLDELLARAVNYIHDRFSFYHASVFLIDPQGENALIREATGDAGVQMKRSGHKLGVGSKSIVGYVASRGDRLVINDTTKDPTYYANPLLPETRAEAASPLKVGDRILGVLDVQSTHAHAFNDDNLRTLQILADQLAIAVVNSELFSETQEHLSQHRLLHHITTSAASGTTLEEALSSAVNGLQVTLGGDRVSISLLDRNLNELRIQAAVGYSDDARRVSVPLGSGVTGWVAAHRRPLRVDNTADEPRYIQLSPDTCSEMAIPLIYRNEVLGVLNVESEQTSAYSDSDEEMLGTLGGSLAAIIANARLLEQIRNQAERERLLFEITSKIRRSTDVNTILATTASELVKVMGARRTQIKIEPATPNVDKGDGNGHDQGVSQ